MRREGANKQRKLKMAAAAAKMRLREVEALVDRSLSDWRAAVSLRARKRREWRAEEGRLRRRTARAGVPGPGWSPPQQSRAPSWRGFMC